jgi:hypothetical protein
MAPSSQSVEPPQNPGRFTYVLIAIAKKRLHLPHSLYEILQTLSLTMYERTPINQLLTPPSTDSTADFEPQQLVLL